MLVWVVAPPFSDVFLLQGPAEPTQDIALYFGDKSGRETRLVHQYAQISAKVRAFGPKRDDNELSWG
jgi:hypothetical protein